MRVPYQGAPLAAAPSSFVLLTRHTPRSDPRWGRNMESAGEDPWATGEYAVQWVKGFQHAPEDPYALQAAACCKHFVANELEGTWDGLTRHNINVNVTQQDLADSYLPPFQACAEQGDVAGFMCSYNAVNGVPSCANSWLLNTVLRQEWQFDGGCRGAAVRRAGISSHGGTNTRRLTSPHKPARARRLRDL